jgi:hypothetical protein
VNACPASPCAAYADGGAEAPTCQNGLCVSNASPFNFTVLVSLPESSLYAPGITVPILFPAAKPTCTSTPATALDENCLHACREPSPPECVQVPSAFEPFGGLIVEDSVFYASNATSYLTGQNQTSLPVHAQFRPLWPPVDDSSVHVEPATIGLPLLPIDATSSQVGLTVSGPGGTLATEWRAPLAQGFYERYIVPDYQGFPGLSGAVSVAGDDSFFPLFSDVDPAAHPVGGAAPLESLPVTSESGESLAGFSVYLRDQTTLRRVSSVTTLTDAPQTCSASAIDTRPPSPRNTCLPGFTCVNVGTATSSPVPGCVPLLLSLDVWPATGAPQGLQVVVEPPAGSRGIPYKADPVVNATLNPGEVFPAMPPPVTVSGALVGPDGTPVVGSLVIDSTSGAKGGGIVTTNPNDPSKPFMYYSTSAQTDSAGNYSVVLPPGTYDVFIAPAPGSNLSATTITLEVAPALGSGPPVAAGKNLVLSELGTMTGRAMVADGRLLVGATVQALPAASLAPTTDPRRWPRSATTTTDATGAFSLALDQGLPYDIVVQPANGTGLPWVTLSNQTVFAGENTNLQFGAPITVPAPMVQELLLHDPSDNPLVRAVIRAYASTATAKNPTPGAPAPMIEIGNWLTDTSGHVTMLLAQPR